MEYTNVIFYVSRYVEQKLKFYTVEMSMVETHTIHCTSSVDDDYTHMYIYLYYLCIYNV